MEAAMRNLLATCLLALCSSGAAADDLQHLLPAATAGGILEQLEDDRHQHFAVIDYARHSSLPRFLLFERDSLRLVDSYRVATGAAPIPTTTAMPTPFPMPKAATPARSACFVPAPCMSAKSPAMVYPCAC